MNIDWISIANSKVFRMVIIIAIAFAIIKVIDAILKKVNNKNTINVKFIRSILKGIIILVVIYSITIDIPQLSNIANTLIASSGVVAIIIGLAAQQSLGNVLSGIIISIFKPFGIGDRITLVNSKITGCVEDINIRHTIIRTFANSRIIVPNSIISNEIIENSNFIEEEASSFIDVIIDYNSDVNKAMKVMADVIGNNDKFYDCRTQEDLDNKKEKVSVYVRDLSVYGVELRASMWTHTVNDNFLACSESRLGIKKAFDELGIKMAINKINVSSN